MARYDYSYDSPLRRGPGNWMREPGRRSGYDRDFGPRPIRIQRHDRPEGGYAAGRYDAPFRGYDANRGYNANRGFGGGGYDRGFRPEYRGGRMQRYDRDFRSRPSGRPIRGSEPGGIFDPFTGPFRPDSGVSNFGAGRPRFFTDYGGGEQSGNRGFGLY